MVSSLSNKVDFHFVCTNFGGYNDGIGHFTSKIVNKLRNDNDFKIYTYYKKTSHLTTLQLFLSLGMTKQLLVVIKKIYNSRKKNFVILEYPFVEYNPIIFLPLLFLKLLKNRESKIVISLHEYSRTKKLRKLFIKILVLFGDVILYTREEDIISFRKLKKSFKKRIIPPNIEPKNKRVEVLKKDIIKICFFGIINFETKEINNMLESWETYIKRNEKSKILFYFISSSFDKTIQKNKNLNYCYNFTDKEVSNLLLKTTYIILPLKPKISINNGSLSVGCIHGCIPIGTFDNKYFNSNFGIAMKNYSKEEFIRIYNLIDNLDEKFEINKRDLAINYGSKNTIRNSADSYLNLVNL